MSDIATTHYELRKDIGTEANPVLRKLFDKLTDAPAEAGSRRFIRISPDDGGQQGIAMGAP